MTANNVTAYTDQEKVDILATSYSNEFSPNPPPIQEHISHTHDTVRSFLDTPIVDPLTEIHPLIILNIIQELKKRKAPGYDNTTNTALKKSSN